MSKERTLSIIKPDAVEKKLSGKIIAHLQTAGFDVLAMKQTHLTKEQAEGFYAVHKARPFYGELVQFMTRSPVVVMVLEAENAIQKYRDTIGATDPKEAAEGTIRKLYGASKGENAMHGSDAKETAAFEIGYFFAGHEVAAPSSLPLHTLAMCPAHESSTEAAGGAVRDAISALQNLYALLRSTRVAPKSITPLLLEIRESCGPVAGAAYALADSLAPHVDDRAPLDALAAFTADASAKLVAAVEKARGAEMDARARLGLEAEVMRHAPTIEAARGLFDVVQAAASEQAVEVDVAEVLEEALAPASQRAVSWSKAMTVAVYLPPRGGSSVLVKPRVVIPLLHLAVAHVHDRSAGQIDDPASVDARLPTQPNRRLG